MRPEGWGSLRQDLSFFPHWPQAAVAAEGTILALRALVEELGFYFNEGPRR